MTDVIERPPSEVAPRDPDRGIRDLRPPPPPDSNALGPSTPDDSRGTRHKRYDGKPEARPDRPIKADTVTPLEDTHAERILTTQAPQRPQATPRIRIEVDGRLVEGLEGQTIL